MSTVLIYTSPARGHLYPMMDTAIALRSAGHRVIVQTLADERDAVVGEGVEHRAMAPEIEQLTLDDHSVRTPIAQFRIALQTWLDRAPHEIEDLGAACGELNPDLIVVDANTWGAAAFAEARGGRWAMFLPYCLPVPSPDTPAFGPGFRPPRGLPGRLRDRLLWSVLGRATRRQMTQLNALRRLTGAEAVDRQADLYLRSDALLYLTAEPFEYPRSQWPPRVYPIGPGLWAPPGTAPDWLKDLPHPRVLVSVSTEYQDDGLIVETALEALSESEGSVVVTTAALDPDRFITAHDRIRIVRHLPHAAVIPEMDVVVTHGGMGTTQRSLAAGVPVCVIPWGRDQSESARRVEVAGAGTMVSRTRLSAGRLRAAVDMALQRTDGARRVADGFSASGGTGRAVGLLEALIDERQRRQAAS